MHDCTEWHHIQQRLKKWEGIPLGSEASGKKNQVPSIQHGVLYAPQPNVIGVVPASIGSQQRCTVEQKNCTRIHIRTTPPPPPIIHPISATRFSASDSCRICATLLEDCGALSWLICCCVPCGCCIRLCPIDTRLTQVCVGS